MEEEYHEHHEEERRLEAAAVRQSQRAKMKIRGLTSVESNHSQAALNMFYMLCGETRAAV